MEQHLDDNSNFDCDDYDREFDDNVKAVTVEENLYHHYGTMMRVIVIIL